MHLLRHYGKGIVSSLLMMVIFSVPAAATYAASFDVIVSKNVSENGLSKTDLQAIFLGEKVKWENRKYIKVVVLENVPAFRDFLQNIVGRTPSQFDQHWMRLVSTGRATIPPYFSEVQQVIDYVAKQPNAISVIPTNGANNQVKVIAVR